jgi:hypothetical protein
MGRILQRCDVCKRFHVVYIVDDPLYPGGKAHYCHHCWKNKFGMQTAVPGKTDPAASDEASSPPVSKPSEDI